MAASTSLQIVANMRSRRLLLPLLICLIGRFSLVFPFAFWSVACKYRLSHLSLCSLHHREVPLYICYVSCYSNIHSPEFLSDPSTRQPSLHTKLAPSLRNPLLLSNRCVQFEPGLLGAQQPYLVTARMERNRKNQRHQENVLPQMHHTMQELALKNDSRIFARRTVIWPSRMLMAPANKSVIRSSKLPLRLRSRIIISPHQPSSTFPVRNGLSAGRQRTTLNRRFSNGPGNVSKTTAKITTARKAEPANATIIITTKLSYS